MPSTDFPVIRCFGPGSSRASERGFSLLEILVAFTILAVTLGVLLQIFSQGIQLVSTGERYSRALLLAESMLDTVGREQEIEIGETQGQTEDDYAWSVAVLPYEDADPESGVGNANFSLYRVRVSVFWENRAVVLETLRFGPHV